jgi:hypothetical protein
VTAGDQHNAEVIAPEHGERPDPARTEIAPLTLSTRHVRHRMRSRAAVRGSGSVSAVTDDNGQAAEDDGPRQIAVTFPPRTLIFELDDPAARAAWHDRDIPAGPGMVVVDFLIEFGLGDVDGLVAVVAYNGADGVYADPVLDV